MFSQNLLSGELRILQYLRPQASLNSLLNIRSFLNGFHHKEKKRLENIFKAARGAFEAFSSTCFENGREFKNVSSVILIG